ncbi:DgyrCDS5654 [Dimorphilus gyrociliatus]|uniref:receptor protein-tyrosine kinase n=1 Tax=Dimorphilus gyrociliatus TaxID=2664684 RepID=A0A7I8VKM3_9ANNE|nr:DgyrCDS5654 [Dimorphilus gyrociliatus]
MNVIYLTLVLIGSCRLGLLTVNHQSPTCSGIADIRIVEQPENRTIACDHTDEWPINYEPKDVKVIIEWYHNGTLMTEDYNQRLNEAKNQMEFRPIVMRNCGTYYYRIMPNFAYYNCSEPQPKIWIKSRTFHVFLHSPAKITSFIKNRIVRNGTVITATCDVQGSPLPKIKWLINNKLLEKETTTGKFNSTIEIKPRFSSNITCQAVNIAVYDTMGNKRKETDSSTATITVIPNNYCSPYKGSFCSFQLMNRNVYHNITEDIRLKDREKFAAKLSGLANEKDEMCRSSVSKFACHSLFPDCNVDRTSKSEPLVICKEDCLTMTRFTCLPETFDTFLQEVEKSFKKDPFIISLVKQMTNCDSLPSSKEGKACTSMNLFHLEKEKITTDCYKDDGRYYNGTVSKTASGIECLPWDHHVPRKLRYHSEYLPLLHENYCRNLGGTKKQPFCYPITGDALFEVCDVAVCEEKKPISKTQAGFFQNSTNIIVCACLLLIIILVPTIIFVVCRSRGNKERYSPAPSMELEHWNIKENVNYHQETERFQLNPVLKRLEYDRNQIIYENDIGEGAFGQVFLAQVKLGKENAKTKAAIKALKEDVCHQRFRDFEREAELLVMFDHSNIVKLLGVCMVKKPYCLIMEYMKYGDLNSFLRKSDPAYKFEAEEESFCDLSDYQRVYISSQIIDGMDYLASKCYVHRDLATRNCLVDDDFITKIGDFGLTRAMKNGSCYQGSTDEAIPVRWQPFEAIMHQIYTQQSDVWSFGVVLYEIFSYAKQPYMGLTHSQVIDLLKDGGRLRAPEKMPNYIETIMNRCLRKSPQDRPVFSQLAEEFVQAIQITLGNIEDQNLNDSFVNGSPLESKSSSSSKI